MKVQKMDKNKLCRDEQGSIWWNQIVRNKAEEKRCGRTVPLLADPHQAVNEFAEYSVNSGGDRYSSVGTAMNEIKAQSKDLVDSLYGAEDEAEVESYGPLLNSSIALFKALESYYSREFFSQRTGTSGD
jgi:hypothetical protein